MKCFLSFSLSHVKMRSIMFNVFLVLSYHTFFYLSTIFHNFLIQKIRFHQKCHQSVGMYARLHILSNHSNGTKHELIEMKKKIIKQTNKEQYAISMKSMSGCNIFVLYRVRKRVSVFRFIGMRECNVETTIPITTTTTFCEH